jgi:acetate kinase
MASPRVLVLNAGSASLKFDVVEADAAQSSPHDGRTILSGILEGIGKDEATLSRFHGKDPKEEAKLKAKDYSDATREALQWIGKQALDGQRGLQSLDLVVHRVVHGGNRFERATVIDDDTIAGIEELRDLAPLHNATALEVIRASREEFGTGQRMVAGFDTVFHRSLPPTAYNYALPADLVERHQIRRFGFHGPSHEYLLRRYCEITSTPLQKASLITMHLESGCSACAIRNGKSMDTSMGFTPLEGLVMGTRSGDIDPALVGYIARREKLDLENVEELLNKKSGLLGISGVSHDTRVLMEQRERNEKVRLALDVFCYRLRKYIGAYLAALEGHAAAIVFGGGIGEDSPWIRQQVCGALEWCGVRLDREANERTINCEDRITTRDSRLAVFVIPTQEALMLAHLALHALAKT